MRSHGTPTEALLVAGNFKRNRQRMRGVERWTRWLSAAGLAAFGFFLGPFVYFAHEKVWDHFGSPRADTVPRLPPPPRSLPAPA